MTVREQREKEGTRRRMSMVLWDMFTGSAPYREIFLRTLHPAFLGRLLGNLARSACPFRGMGGSDHLPDRSGMERPNRTL